ncbi:MAG: DUF2683 family protein [Nanoarchaeota archaeon]
MNSNKTIKALVKLDEREDQVLNIVKAKYRLRNKNDALRLVIREYENNLEPELRPEYIKKLKRIEKEGKYVGPFTSVEELDKHIKSNA